MAPRTKEQQLAYNEKRRAESAAKKLHHERTAPLKMDGIKGERIDKSNPELVKLGKAKFDKPKAVVAKAVKTAAKMAKATKPKRKTGKSPVLAQKFAAKKPSAKPIKGVDVEHVPTVPRGGEVFKKKKAVGPHAPPPKATTLTTPKHDVAKQVAKLGADSLLPPETHTMARSYLRNGEPGAGMKRGANYQATVTFTEEQFLQLRDKAGFNNRSMAEQIRWCCIQQLKA